MTAQDGVTLDPPTSSEQVFATPGDPEGPRLVLHHFASSDAHGPLAPGEERVRVGEVDGYLTRPAADELVLRWSPPLGDNSAEIEARGLTQQEVVDFANDLQARDQDGFEFPGTTDTFGFDPGFVPVGLEEEVAGEAPDGSGPGHLLVAEGDSATAELTVMPADDPDRRATLDQLDTIGGEWEELTILGRPAELMTHPGGFRWSAVWQPQDGAERGARRVGRRPGDDRRRDRRPPRGERGRVGGPRGGPLDPLTSSAQPGGGVSPGPNRQRVASWVKASPSSMTAITVCGRMVRSGLVSGSG